MVLVRIEAILANIDGSVQQPDLPNGSDCVDGLFFSPNHLCGKGYVQTTYHDGPAITSNQRAGQQPQ